MNKQADHSALRVVEFLSNRFPQVDLPQSFVSFLRSQDGNGHRIHRVDSGEPLVEFFKKQDVPSHFFSQFLSHDSRLVPQIDYPVLLDLSPEEVFTYILDRFSSLFDIQETALETEVRTGFNRHGREHLRTVAKNTLELLREAQIVPADNHQVENEALFGAFFHDIGNLIARRYHGLYGIYILTRLCKNFEISEPVLESFLNVLETVLFHEVEYGSRLPTLTLLRPSTLSLIIADKTDVNFRRVSSRSNVPEAIEDAHVLINLLVANSSIRRIKGTNGRFRWTIDFRSQFDPARNNLFSRLLKATGRVKVPDEWQAVYEDAKIEMLFIFNSTFLRVYLSRLYFTIRAVFALYPSVQEFRFVVDDAERGISLMRTFSPEDYREKVFTLGKHLYKQEWPDTYIHQALERQSTLMAKGDRSRLLPF